MSALLATPLVVADAAAASSIPVGAAREVRTTWTSELGVARPDGIAYDARRGELLVADERNGSTTALRLGFDEEPKGTTTLAGVADAGSLAYDATRDELVAPDSGSASVVPGNAMTMRNPVVTERPLGDLVPATTDGATFDTKTGSWYLLRGADRAVLRVDGGAVATGRATRTPLQAPEPGRLQGIAYNPADGLVYVANTDRALLYAFDAAGTVRKRYSLSSIPIGDLAAMTFAPSADPTDSTARYDLYVADAGTSTTSGGVTEITLAAQPLAALAVTNQTASLVQVIQTSRFSPPSPDPSGIAWLPGPDRLLIVDSEVEEVTGAGYHGVNLWQSTRGGTVVDTGTLYPAVSKEPTGTDYDPGTGTLFVSDDSKGGVHVIRPGPDGRFGTADDSVRFIALSALGSGDTEDPAFDPTTGHLYVSDAISAEIFEVDPVNGVFGDGNDLTTHFDVGRHGVVDGEGLAFDSVRNTLLVGDRSSRRIYEITKSNELVRVIDARVAGLTVLSGLTVAPAIDNPARRDYWIVDRAVDNGPNPSENDGKIFEVSAPAGPVDAPPAVSFASPGDGATVSGANVTVQVSASDDVGVTQVQFFDGTTSIGIDSVAGDGWSVTWDTTATANGSHTLRATATDTAGQTATATRSVTVLNGSANSPPTVAISSPAPNTTVSGANVTVQASASDDVGVTQVQFFDGTTSIGIDSVAGDGWSVTWDTTATSDGPHSLTARATDTGGLTATSAAVPVSVLNGVPGTTTVLDVPITNGSDDVEERLSDGRVDRASTDLDMMLDNTTVQSAIGLRFTGLTIPRGAVVTSAYVQFRADETWSDPTTLSISGIASDNAPLFPTGRFSLSTAARTQAAGSWSPAGWIERNRGPDQRTANIAAVLQELIDRPGWQPGNAVALVITGSGRRVAKAFEAGATSAPVLHVEYTVVSGS